MIGKYQLILVTHVIILVKFGYPPARSTTYRLFLSHEVRIPFSLSLQPFVIINHFAGTLSFVYLRSAANAIFRTLLRVLYLRGMPRACWPNPVLTGSLFGSGSGQVVDWNPTKQEEVLSVATRLVSPSPVLCQTMVHRRRWGEVWSREVNRQQNVSPQPQSKPARRKSTPNRRQHRQKLSV